MKATVNTAQLREALAIACRAITSKISMPILSCVRLKAEAESGRIWVSGTNLDQWITTSFPAKVDESGSVCVYGQRWLGIVGACDGEEATLAVSKSHTMTFKCGRSEFKLMGIGDLEFPAHAELAGGAPTLNFTQEQLSAAINAVEEAQSEDEGRYILNGVYVVRSGGVVKFVATDGRRLHVANRPAVKDGDCSFIVPLSAVSRVTSLLNKGEVVIRYTDKQCQFTISRPAGDIIVGSKLVEGNYPNYKQVIPARSTCIKVEREALIASVSRCRLALDEKNSSLRVEFAGNQIELHASSPDCGEAHETVGCENPDGIAGKIAMNAGYLLEALRGMDAEFVTLLPGAAKTMDVESLRINQGDENLAVIMPVRLS